MAIQISVPSTETVAFSEQDAKIARLWAIDQGHKVPARGRLSGDLMLAWHFAGRPHYDVAPAKFTVPKDEKKRFRAWADENGHETDAEGYAAWEAADKADAATYWDPEILGIVDAELADGTIAQYPVTRERMAEIRGGKTGKPKSREYLSAADLPHGAEPKRLVTSGGAVHTVEIPTEDDSFEDQAFGYVVRWQSKRDGNAQLLAQIEALTAQVDAVTAERDAALSELDTVRAELSAAQATPKRATRARKPAAQATDKDA